MTARATTSADGCFPPTQWSTVISAREESPSGSLALEELCQAYWYPLYAYVRRRGQNPADAQDMTQAFFAHFLAGHGFSKFQPDRGRFRNFLLASFQNFISNDWDRVQAQKRGGGNLLVSLENGCPEASCYEGLDPALSAERVYDRAWGLTVIARARAQLKARYEAEGKVERFQLFELLLPGGESPLLVEEVATRLGISKGSVRSEVHRLKGRFRAAVRAEVAKTMHPSDDIDEEIRSLIVALGS